MWSARDQRIRQAHLAGLAAAGRINDLDADIARKRRAEHLQLYIDELRREKGRVLAELSALTVPPKDRWSQRLESIDPTSTSALDELGQLRQDVERHRGMFTTPPVPPERTVNPVLLRLRHEEEERQTRRRAIAEQFDPVISALADLIDSVRRYESARS